MAANTNTKILSLILMVVGIGLAVWGFNEADSTAGKVTEAVTGSYSDETMMMLIGGAASFIVGLYLFIKK
ncbi:DUF3185 family protein [Lacimicrobium sp. SS2-24]|uniref:DUF3185 family protein n=1 Tax=Lacimicrobium sp. SS2-24 TaxID=2005569 RepID=UPI000B4ACAF2|nr:DUF3185 family protein [Lacimicrobium sp. SS2-24]